MKIFSFAIMFVILGIMIWAFVMVQRDDERAELYRRIGIAAGLTMIFICCLHGMVG